MPISRAITDSNKAAGGSCPMPHRQAVHCSVPARGGQAGLGLRPALPTRVPQSEEEKLGRALIYSMGTTCLTGLWEEERR